MDPIINKCEEIATTENIRWGDNVMPRWSHGCTHQCMCWIIKGSDSLTVKMMNTYNLKYDIL